MKIHRVRSSNFEDFMTTPNLITHIVVGYAELESNSDMFGGKDSVSYKIKFKNYEKFSKRALSIIKQKPSN